MRKYFLQLIMCFGVIFFSSSLMAQTTISGKVTDASNGDALIGVSIQVQGTTKGTLTNLDGEYRMEVPADAEVLLFSYTGYQTQEIAIDGKTTIDVSMATGLDLEQVVVSASRKAEKAVDAPASVSVLSPEKLSVVADGGLVVNGLKNTVGVSVVDQGIDRSAIQLRGSAIVNQNRVQVYRDNRPMTELSSQNFESQLTPVSGIDIKQVEVIRGPGGALYGPGVDAGVIHFITMDPWDKSGTTVSVTGGEQNLLKFDIRHAGVINEKLGYKILLGGMRATDFQLEESLAEDVVNNQWDSMTTIVGNADFDGIVIDHGGNLLPDVGNQYGTAALYYKPTDKISLTATYDYAQFKGNRRNVQGDFYLKQTRHNAQLKAQVGDLFAAFNYTLSPIGDGTLEGPQYQANYANGAISHIGTDEEIKAEIQYPFSLGPVDFVAGGDYLSYIPEDNFLRGGRNANINYTIYGGYLQLKYAILENLAFTAVGRVDNFVNFETTAFSPRAALVYKPNPASQVRVSYNRSYSSMNPVRTFLDFRLASLGFGANIQAAGGTQAVTYDDAIVFGLPFAQGLNGSALTGDAIPLSGFLAGGPLAGALTNALGATDFAALQAAVAGQTTGATYTLFRENTPIATLQGHGSQVAKLTTTNTFEIGYKGVIRNKLAIQVDIYNNRIENFESNAVPLTPFIQAPSLATDLEAIANAAGLDGAAVAAAVAGTPYANGANIGIAESSFSQSRPDPTTPPQVNFGFLNFGLASYWGYDLGLEYYINKELSVFGNFSGLSQNSFTLEELGEEADSGFPAQYLNTPTNRIRFGANYIQKEGLFGSIAYSYNAEYEAVSGIYNGTVEARSLVDLTIGYAMSNGLKVTLSAANLLNNKYSYFPRLPEIGRVVTLNAQYHFGGKKKNN